jgi:hypothetical protein
MTLAAGSKLGHYEIRAAIREGRAGLSAAHRFWRESAEIARDKGFPMASKERKA